MTAPRAVARPGQPSPRQQETWDAYGRLRSYEAVAYELGISTARVGQILTRYRQVTGVQRPYRAGAYAEKMAELRGYRERVPGMEDELSRLRQRVADLEAPGEALERIEAKLDRALTRSAVAPKVVPIDHRRLSDGGKRARQQVREARG